MVTQHFGSVATSTVRGFGAEQYPLLLVVMKNRSAMEICSVLQGKGRSLSLSLSSLPPLSLSSLPPLSLPHPSPLSLSSLPPSLSLSPPTPSLSPSPPLSPPSLPLSLSLSRPRNSGGETFSVVWMPVFFKISVDDAARFPFYLFLGGSEDAWANPLSGKKKLHVAALTLTENEDKRSFILPVVNPQGSWEGS